MDIHCGEPQKQYQHNFPFYKYGTEEVSHYCETNFVRFVLTSIYPDNANNGQVGITDVQFWVSRRTARACQTGRGDSASTRQRSRWYST